MTGVPAGLEAELRHLRKGEGIFAERLADRVGPRLRLVAGVPDGADTGEIRQRVMAWLVTATATLGDQEWLAAAAAFAVPPAGGNASSAIGSDSWQRGCTATNALRAGAWTTRS